MKKLLFSLFLSIQSVVMFAQDMIIYGYDPKVEYYSVYLGKIIATNDDDKSIWNTDGLFGDNTSDVSIWNAKGLYGSDTSDYSPFNAEAKYPPKVLDEEKHFYGYFTTNKTMPNRCDYDILDIICKLHDKISNDVKKYYEMFFN